MIRKSAAPPWSRARNKPRAPPVRIKPLSSTTIEFIPPPPLKLRIKVFTGNTSAPSVDTSPVALAERALAEMSSVCRESFDRAAVEIREIQDEATGASSVTGRLAHILRSVIEIKRPQPVATKPAGRRYLDLTAGASEHCRALGKRQYTGNGLHLNALDAACRNDTAIADDTRSDAATLFEQLNTKNKSAESL